MKKCVYIVFISMALLACGKKIKMTSLAKPLKTINTDFSSGFKNVSFLFILDTSGSMSKIHKTMVDNLKYLFPVINDYSSYNYNFAITTMNSLIDFEDPTSPPLLYTSPKDELSHFCTNSKEQEVDLFVRETSLGNYLSYNSSISSKDNLEKLSCLFSESTTSLSFLWDRG